jgi:hypothetical protein
MAMKSSYRNLWDTVILALLVILPVGCSKEPPNPQFVGLWQGTITEEKQSLKYELFLYIDEDKNVLKGIINITNTNDTSSDITSPREIVKIETAGNKLKFVVPMTGKIDDNALIMNLELGNNRLIGSYQRKKSGSISIQITLTKKPSPQADPNSFLLPTS